MTEKKQLEEIANIFPQISSWINWWDARIYHIFPAFRQLGYSNVTLAESGNSTLKQHAHNYGFWKLHVMIHSHDVNSNS